MHNLAVPRRPPQFLVHPSFPLDGDKFASAGDRLSSTNATSGGGLPSDAREIWKSSKRGASKLKAASNPSVLTPSVAQFPETHRPVFARGQRWWRSRVHSLLSERCPCMLHPHYRETRLSHQNATSEPVFCRRRHCTLVSPRWSDKGFDPTGSRWVHDRSLFRRNFTPFSCFGTSRGSSASWRFTSSGQLSQEDQGRESMESNTIHFSQGNKKPDFFSSDQFRNASHGPRTITLHNDVSIGMCPLMTLTVLLPM